MASVITGYKKSLAHYHGLPWVLSVFAQGIPFRWNKDRGIPRLSNISPVCIRMMKVIAFSAIILGIMVHKDAMFNKKHANISTKSQVSYTGTVLICYGGVYLDVLSLRGSIVTTLNAMITFERRIIADGIQFANQGKILLSRIVCLMIILSTVQFPFLFGIAGALAPDIPINSFQFLVNDCCSFDMAWMIRRALFGLGNFSVWFFLCTSRFFWVELLLCLTYIRVGLLTCFRKLKEGDGVFKNSTATHSLHLFYQQIQLLTTYYNIIHSRSLLRLLVIVSHVQIISLYVLLQTQTNIPIATIVISVLINMDSVGVIVGVYGYAADISTLSSKLQRKFRQSNKYTHNSLGRKLVNGLQTMRIRLGHTNYIDNLTPIVFLNFNLIRVVDLLLSSNGRMVN